MGKNDPIDPSYSPSADADHRVGSGTDFGADLYGLFRAGRTTFPGLAQDFYAMTSAVHTTGPDLTYQSGLSGSPAVLTALIDLRDDLQEALRVTTVALSKVGPALVEIATDYARTDEAAAGEFHRLQAADEKRGLYDHLPRPAPTPPRTGDPQPDEPAPVPSRGRNIAI